jgi:hypothetical protein
LPNCQIELVLPNHNAKSNCQIVKLNSFCQIKMPTWIAKSKYLIKLPDRLIEFVLPNQIAKSNCQI